MSRDLKPSVAAQETAAAIAERLEGLRELHLLGMSLLHAEGPAISHAMFLRRSIGIEGLASESDLRLRPGGFVRRPRGVHDLWIRFGTSGKRHEVGAEFDLLLPFGAETPTIDRCVLVGVALDSGEPGDALPPDRRGSCCLRFFERVPEAVSSLPITGASGSVIRVWLGAEADWRKLHAGGR